jgi:hypothetical protein
MATAAQPPPGLLRAAIVSRLPARRLNARFPSAGEITAF